MKSLVITTYHVQKSEGYAIPNNPVAIAFAIAHPEMTNVQVTHNRLTAIRDGYPVRFQVIGYSTKDHLDLVHGRRQEVVCLLRVLPVQMTEMV
jgi:hypothetical protein